MKRRYIAFIGILTLMFVGFEWAIFASPFGRYSQLQNSIQGAGIFVALLTAITALSTADRKKKRVVMKIDPSIDVDEKKTYRFSELAEGLRKAYKGFPDPFESYRVKFRMTNNSNSIGSGLLYCNL